MGRRKPDFGLPEARKGHDGSITMDTLREGRLLLPDRLKVFRFSVITLILLLGERGIFNEDGIYTFRDPPPAQSHLEVAKCGPRIANLVRANVAISDILITYFGR